MSPEKSSSVSLRSECQAYIALLAGPRENRDSRESWIAKAARPPALSLRKIKSLYYGEITDPDHPAVVALKDAADRYELESLASQIDELGKRVRAIIHKRIAGGRHELVLDLRRR
jgi:hypothetical protein